MRNQFHSSFVIALTALAMFCSGCGDLIPPRPPINRVVDEPMPQQAESANGQTGVADANETSPAGPFEGDWSAWYVHRFGSQVVGATEFGVTTSVDPTQLLATPTEVRYHKDEQMIFRSGRTSFVRHVVLTSVETLEGTVKDIQTVIDTGPVSSQIRGTRVNDRISIKTSGAATGNDRLIECPGTTRGMFAVEQTLRRRVIGKGETRRLNVLLPSLDAIGVVELHCVGDASVAMLDGNYRLLREVEVTTFRDANLIDSYIVWVTGEGVIEKMLRPELRLESFHTDHVSARTLFTNEDLSAVTVHASGALRVDAEPTQVAFVIGQRSESPMREDPGQDRELAIPPVANQAVRQIEEGLQVLVSTAAPSAIPSTADSTTADSTTAGSPSADGFQRDDSAPSSADASASKLIDIDHASVTRMAESIGDLPRRSLASELAHLTQNDLSLFPQGELRSASAIIRSGKAGVIDHAVVLAALLRARQIPARVAIGLSRSVPADTGGDRVTMKLAGWVVASIDGKWVTIDPMSARFNRADQLCLSRPEDDAKLRDAVASVMRRLMDINIEVRGATYE